MCVFNNLISLSLGRSDAIITPLMYHPTTKETWWWDEEVQESIRKKRLAKKRWDIQRDEESKQEYKEMRR